VLNEFAQILRRNVRDIDHSARFGGDEFMLLLPNTTTAEAVQVAARIRNQVARKIFDNGQYQMKVTVSIGLDTYDGRGLSSPDDLRSRANRALKEAKRLGKNRIWLYSGGETLDTRALDDEIDELSADPQQLSAATERSEEGPRGFFNGIVARPGQAWAWA
jgi:predicted signal transduction protein with EAL and GGDEF domain